MFSFWFWVSLLVRVTALVAGKVVPATAGAQDVVAVIAGAETEAVSVADAADAFKRGLPPLLAFV